MLHLFHRHPGGVGITQDNHAQRIANQQERHARLIQQACHRKIVRGQGGDLFAARFHRPDGFSGYLFHAHAAQRSGLGPKSTRGIWDPRQSRNAVNGLVGLARSAAAAIPVSNAARPASTAMRKALAIRVGSEATAMAVFTSTASAPISRAWAAWLGAPMPASTMTGTVACSMMISIWARVSMPRLDPIGEPSGMTVAVPASCRRRARTGSALM